LTNDARNRDKEEDFLEFGLAFGGEWEQAIFRYYMIATEVQREIAEVVSASDNSFGNLLLKSRGASDDAVGRTGRFRGSMVISSIAVVLEYNSDIINAVAWIHNANGDDFEVEFVPGEKLITQKRVDLFWKRGLIEDRERVAILTGIRKGMSPLVRFSKGDIITNKPISLSKTASERLDDNCTFVKKRLPTKVKLAKVIRPDWADHSVKWRCLDSQKTGWVEMGGVEIANTTRQGDSNDEDEDSSGNLFNFRFGR
jgi:hypothetical protein